MFRKAVVFLPHLIAMTIAAIAIASWITYWDVEKIVSNARFIRYGNQVLILVETIEIMIDEAESSQRGYLITSDPKYLERMKVSTKDLPHAFDRMMDLTRNDPDQQSKVSVLREKSRAKIEEMNEVLDEFRREGIDRAREVMKEDRGFQLMKEFRIMTRELRDDENRLIKSRGRIVTKIFDRLVLELWVLKILFLVVIYFMIRKALNDRSRLQNVPVITLPVAPEVVLTERH